MGVLTPNQITNEMKKQDSKPKEKLDNILASLILSGGPPDIDYICILYTQVCEDYQQQNENLLKALNRIKKKAEESGQRENILDEALIYTIAEQAIKDNS